jgi:predicted DNA-binding transcriptional regulator AlpA
MNTLFLRMVELEAYIGLRSATIYKKVREGLFPPPLKIGEGQRAVSVWRRDEVDAFVERLTKERDERHPYNPEAVKSVYRSSGRPRKAKAVEAEVAA